MYEEPLSWVHFFDSYGSCLPTQGHWEQDLPGGVGQALNYAPHGPEVRPWGRYDRGYVIRHAQVAGPRLYQSHVPSAPQFPGSLDVLPAQAPSNSHKCAKVSLNASSSSVPPFFLNPLYNTSDRNMGPLDALAPELLVLIQQALDSPRDLYALIAASPVCLHIFDSHRASILASVLINSVEPVALHHALAVSHAPTSLTDGTSMRPRLPVPKVPPPLQSFLDEYFCNSLEIPTDIPRLTSLCRLQRLVSRFSNDYFLHTTRLLQIPPANETGPAYSAPLSLTERARLERAFFRYELYSRLFPLGPGMSIKSVFSGGTQFGLFLERLEPWEVEEISCVHNYFTSLVRELIVALEDRVVRAVLMSPGLETPDGAQPSFPDAVTHGSPSNNSKPPDRCNHQSTPGADNSAVINCGDRLDRNQELVPFADLELHGLTLFETVRRRDVPRFISNMASFGLEHMARLLDGDDDQKKVMIRKHAPFGRDFLPEALKHTPLLDSEHPPPAHAEGDVLDNDPRHPNLGYVLFSRKGLTLYHEIYNHSRDLVYNPLRERGYVFWDSARVKIPAVQQCLKEAKDVSRDTVLSKSWLRRESVEERLSGVRIPRSQMRSVIREFGDGYGDGDDEANIPSLGSSVG